MPLWMSYTLCLIFFLVTGFLGIWAIREGGNFNFLRRSYWRAKTQGPEAARPEPLALRSIACGKGVGSGTPRGIPFPGGTITPWRQPRIPWE